jgi:hypothetical protein
MFNHKPAEDGSPCPQMRTLLSQLSDGELRGIGRWYAEKHTAHCPRCTAALEGLVSLEERLRDHGLNMSPEHGGSSVEMPNDLRRRIDSEMDRVDSLAENS